MKTETPKIFIQVFIKSEQDLPKVLHETQFWAHTRSDRMIKTNIAWTWRVNDIDWYLQPVDPQEWGIIDHRIPPMPKTLTFKEWMEYAEQIFKQSEQSVEPQPDINTPFFGNTGAKIPIEPKQTAEEGIRDLRNLLVIINEQIERPKDCFLMDLKALWNSISDSISKIEYAQNQQPEVSDEDYRKHGRAT